MAHAGGAHAGQISGFAIEYGNHVEWQSANVQMQSRLAQITAPPAAPKFWNGWMWLGLWGTVAATALTLLVSYWFKQLMIFLARIIQPVGAFTFLNPFAVVGGLSDLFFMPVFILGLVIAVKWRDRRYKEERQGYENRLDHWHHSVICLRCGDTWTI